MAGSDQKCDAYVPAYVPAILKQRIRARANRERRSISDVVRLALEKEFAGEQPVPA